MLVAEKKAPTYILPTIISKVRLSHPIRTAIQNSQYSMAVDELKNCLLIKLNDPHFTVDQNKKSLLYLGTVTVHINEQTFIVNKISYKKKVAWHNAARSICQLYVKHKKSNFFNEISIMLIFFLYKKLPL